MREFTFLSSFWLMKVSQHPVMQPILGAILEIGDEKNLMILFASFLGFVLTTSHTGYFSDQVIATIFQEHEMLNLGYHC